MDTENFLVDHCRKRHHIEGLLEFFPHFNVVPAFAFIIEAVNAIDCRAFVVAAEQEKIFRVSHLICEQQADCLQAILTAVDIITAQSTA